jgi:hypothetical protein
MIPPPPAVGDDQRGTGTYRLRFEDLTQDGRLQLETVVASVGASVWVPVLNRHPMAAALEASGIRPIFTRLVVETEPIKLGFMGALSAKGLYELSQEQDSDGAVKRLYLNMWTEVAEAAGAGGTGREGPRAGRLFAEHVLTRPFAPAGQRRVTELPGFPTPSATYRQPRPEDLLALPEGASWIEPAMRSDATPFAFGLAHTDRNQHVNSLVYPRIFEDAALRRFSLLQKETRVLGRSLEIAFRKPFLAGQVGAIVLRAFSRGEGLGAVGTFVDAAEDPGEAKAHTFVRMGFDP